MKYHSLFPTHSPFCDKDAEKHPLERGRWPAYFLRIPETHTACLFGVTLKCATEKTLCLHFTGADAYQLYCDGVMLVRGPESGDPAHWPVQTLTLTVEAGVHELRALCFDYQGIGPVRTMPIGGGFLLAAEGEVPEFCNTGLADWRVVAVDAWQWLRERSCGPDTAFRAMEWDVTLLTVPLDDYPKPRPGLQGINADTGNECHGSCRLVPAEVPMSMEYAPVGYRVLLASEEFGAIRLASSTGAEARIQEALIQGTPFAVPAGCKLRVLCKFDTYACFYPELTATGDGTCIRLTWMETLRHCDDENNFCFGDRNEIEGKFVRGIDDCYYPANGESAFFLPDYRAGRYLSMDITVGCRPCILGRLRLTERPTPFLPVTVQKLPWDELARVLDPALLTVRNCVFDTFSDCPFYERTMYVGDSRLIALVCLSSVRDDRVVRKMLKTFAWSQEPSGWLCSRYPCRVAQHIPVYAPLWIGALADYALYRGDEPFVRSLLGNAEHIAAAFEQTIDPATGVAVAANGWNFVDWVETWPTGVPPDGDFGLSSVVNLLYLYGLEQLARIAGMLDEPEKAAYYRKRKFRLAQRVKALFQRPETGLFASSPGTREYCEHSQCLALLADILSPEEEQKIAGALFSGAIPEKCTLYFSHYYFECCHKMRRIDAFLARMQLWDDFLQRGVVTLPERSEPGRSDCHAWSSHIYYHAAATIAGIRPEAFAFRKLRIEPLPFENGPLHAEVVHPKGLIVLDMADAFTGAIRVVLPDACEGNFIFPDGTVQPLHPGEQSFGKLIDNCASGGGWNELPESLRHNSCQYSRAVHDP